MVLTLVKEHLYIKLAIALIVLLAPIVLIDYRRELSSLWARFRRLSKRSSSTP